MTDEQYAAQAPAEQELSLIDLLIAVGEEKWTIITAAFIATAIGLAVALLLTPVYTARTTLLPPQQGGGGASAAMAASLGALAATAGVASAFKTPEELYVGLLKTDSVANALIDRFKLQERFEQKSLTDTRRTLTQKVRVSADRKSTLISIDVDDEDPVFAAQLANAYTQELRMLMGRIAVTEAQQRRVFFEQQMNKAKDELARAELAAKHAQDQGGLVSVDAQTQTLIGSAAQIRAQIVARDVQLQALRPYTGPENPELKRLLSELASLRSQLARLETGGAAGAAKGGSDKDALANVRLFRELKYQEAIYSAMLQQYQLARSDEARDAPLLQQVDVAIPPDRKSKPQRAFIVLGALAAGLMLGLMIAFLRRMARQAQNNPQTAGQWQTLAAAWSLHRSPAARSE
jgi:tyrosine-protein kinase Etk/Wzc